MILIGQYDSPFVRRVAITLRLYDISFEHRRWSVWGDAERIAEVSPLMRAPTLVLDDGTPLVDTFAIVDFLDELAGERALLPRSGPVRRAGLQVAALASGIAEKAASLMYEPMFRKAPSEAWMERCRRQILGTLASLEKERAGQRTKLWLGETLSHADVAVVCALRFTREAHPALVDLAQHPALAAHSAHCERLDSFAAIQQPIINNVPPPR